MIEAVDNSLVIVPDDNYLVQGVVEEDGTIEITKCYEGDNNIVNSDYKADYFKIKNGSYNVIHGGSSLLDGRIDVFALVGIGNASDNFLYGDEGIDLFVVDSDGSNTIVGGSGDDIYNIGWMSGKVSEVLGSQKMELVIDQAGAASTDKDTLTIRNVDYGFVDSSIGSLTMSDFSTMKDLDGNYIIEDKYGAKVVIKNNADKSISKIVFEGFNSGNVEIGIEEIVAVENQKEGFFAEGYLFIYKDVATAGLDAWDHYSNWGRYEGRGNGYNFTSDIFLANRYLELNPDVAAAGIDPWEHYVQWGRSEGRSNGIVEEMLVEPSETVNPEPTVPEIVVPESEDNRFFAEGYLFLNPDVAAAQLDAWYHYETYGKSEGRGNGYNPPAEVFSAEGYLNINTDVLAAGIDPWEHYVLWGKNEGRSNGLDWEELRINTINSSIGSDKADGRAISFEQTKENNSNTAEPTINEYTEILSGIYVASTDASLVSSLTSQLTNPLSSLNTAAISFASDSSIGSMNYNDNNSNENSKTQFLAQS